MRCEDGPIGDPFDKRLLFVTGKGGVGKTSVAFALGLAAAARGKRAIVCEIASQERGAALFGRKPVGFTETQVAPGLWAISIDPDLMVREYIEVQLPVRAMAEVLNRSRIFGYLAAATPGLAEMVTMGKVWELAQDLEERRAPGAERSYDQVIVDAPATGHGIALLQTPRNFREIARAGPLARQAETIERTIHDPERTGVAIVARPEEMAVNETIALADALDADPGGFAIDAVLANAVQAGRFEVSEIEELERLSDSAGAAGAAAAAAALRHARRAESQREQLDRLRDAVHAPVRELPLLVGPSFGTHELGALAEALR